MAAVIDNLKTAIRFVMDLFNYILSFFTSFGAPEGGEEGATE